jgi:hypothetical protein
MNINVFGWIREGVRQSVLAGVSDAIEQMGTTVDGDDLRPRMADVLRRQSSGVSDAPVVGEARTRRLGRSLKDFDADKGK